MGERPLTWTPSHRNSVENLQLSGAGATPPLSRLFPQFRVCRRGVAATPPLKGPVPTQPRSPVALNWLLGKKDCGTATCEGNIVRSVAAPRVVCTSETLSRSRGWSSYTCECGATDCTKPSHSQSLADFITNFHSQGNSAARTKF